MRVSPTTAAFGAAAQLPACFRMPGGAGGAAGNYCFISDSGVASSGS